MFSIDPQIGEKLRRTGLEFLLEDIETALTFIGIARSADDNLEKKSRNQRHARKAYETVQKLADRLHLSPEQQDTINEKLARLKTELEAVGERF